MFSPMLSPIKLVIITVIIIIVIILAAVFADKVMPKEYGPINVSYGIWILVAVCIIGAVYTGFQYFNNVQQGVSSLFSKPKPVKQANTLNTYKYY